MRNYRLLDLGLDTPKLQLRSATDNLLDELADVVRAGKTHARPAPYDDPMSFYETDPDVRVTRWLRNIWQRRAQVDDDFWRLYFIVVLDGQPVGEQTLTALHFKSIGTVTTFSWLSTDVRGQGLGREMREAILHLAFEGLDAREAASDAFLDNDASNAVSRSLGYEPNGTDWATRQGEPAQLQRWRLTREVWQGRRRDDISIVGLEAAKSLLPLS
ncbi:GNAT family N-acetyltransferase [Flexivirga meconopsidis]|uniref:GNAT family N-acetyltransferase n=1 Tax=Flexivirga meconopsidis TaxID=2977121 RepID=UPI00223F4174|nr:GNAT family protein [Flexivirga meconopsidis]